MPTYFGHTTPSATYTDDNWDTYRNKGYITGYTCPGSGSQVAKELSVYCKSIDGGSIPLRLAIYDPSHNLVGQGKQAFTLSNTTADWYGHLTQAEIVDKDGILPSYLIGGQQYDLAFTFYSVSTNFRFFRDFGSPGDSTVIEADYTGGFPSTLADGTDISRQYNVRCGVDPAPQNYILSAEPGSYAQTVQSAGLRSARKITASPGSYALTGQSATLKAIRKIAGGIGSYSFTGFEVSLVYSGGGKTVRIVGINVIDGKVIYLTGKLYET